MPNTREKLIELLQNCVDENVDTDDGYVGVEIRYGNIADYLIRNGVTLESYDCHWATEQAYKNGYEKGYADGVKELAEKIFEAFPSDMYSTTISRFFIRTIVKGLVGGDNERTR